MLRVPSVFGDYLRRDSLSSSVEMMLANRNTVELAFVAIDVSMHAWTFADPDILGDIPFRVLLPLLRLRMRLCRVQGRSGIWNVSV